MIQKNVLHYDEIIVQKDKLSKGVDHSNEEEKLLTRILRCTAAIDLGTRTLRLSKKATFTQIAIRL